MLRGKKVYSILLSLGTAAVCLVSAPVVLAATTIGNDVSIGGTLSVTGAATTTIVTTSLYISVGGTPASFNASYAAGSANLKGNLSVDGTAAVSSTLIVGGVSTFRGNILADANNIPNIGGFGSAFKNVYSSGTLFGSAATFVGAAGVSSTVVTSSLYLSVGGTPASFNASFAAGSANLKGNLSVDGTAAVSSTLIVGGAATFRGNLLADANNVPSLGAYGSAFKDVYSSGTIFGAAVSLTGASTLTTVTSSIVTTSQYLSVGATPASFNASFTGGSINAAKLSLDGAAAVSSTLIVGGAATFRGNLLADANNVPDIGAFASAFKNVYASGSLFAASSTIYNPVNTSTIYMNSGVANTGGRIILKGVGLAANTCLEVYFGATAPNGALGLATSTISCTGF